MSGRCCLDTNAVIAIFANDASIARAIVEFDEAFVSAVVVGELMFGAENSSRPRDNRLRIEEFCKDVVVLDCGFATAVEYGTIKQALRAAGTPIPENDIWIAAQALERSLPLVSRDRHFSRILGLRCVPW